MKLAQRTIAQLSALTPRQCRAIQEAAKREMQRRKTLGLWDYEAEQERKEEKNRG